MKAEEQCGTTTSYGGRCKYKVLPNRDVCRMHTPERLQLRSDRLEAAKQIKRGKDPFVRWRERVAALEAKLATPELGITAPPTPTEAVHVMEAAAIALQHKCAALEAEIASLRPMPSAPNVKHWQGCWRVFGHHECAVQEIDRLFAHNAFLGGEEV